MLGCGRWQLLPREKKDTYRIVCVVGKGEHEEAKEEKTRHKFSLQMNSQSSLAECTSGQTDDHCWALPDLAVAEMMKMKSISLFLWSLGVYE